MQALQSKTSAVIIVVYIIIFYFKLTPMYVRFGRRTYFHHRLWNCSRISLLLLPPGVAISQ